jgi:hypothetical protein
MASSSIQVRPTTTTVDPITALIAAHAPTTPAEILRPLPVMSEAARADWDRVAGRGRPAYGDSDFPRGLIPVAGIRCGEYL